MTVNVPVPSNLLEVTWFLIGFTFARAFKRFDYDLQESTWFKTRGGLTRWILRRLMDFFHHFWVGLLLMCYAWRPEVYWFGAGIFVDDLPDLPRRLKKLFFVGE